MRQPIMKPVRFAIIGSGGIAAKHAQAIAAVPGAELAAVWGQNPDRALAFAKEHHVEFVPEIETLALRGDIDAATIATPSGSHEATASPFLIHSKAVLCEKPLELTLEKIDRMLALSSSHRAPLAAVLQLRLGAGARVLKKAVEEGRFGRLALCSAYLKWWREQSYYDAVSWRGTRELDGGGALMNQGIHGVDLLQWLVGMPSQVFAFSGLLAHERIEVEDTIAISLRYPGGALGVIEAATSCRPGLAMRIEVCGDKGTAILEDDRLVRWSFETEKPEDQDVLNAESGGIKGGSSDPRSIGFEGHRILIQDLVDSIHQNRAPMIPGEEARNAVRLILAAYESSARGVPVDLSEKGK
jgi:predicted dehydrogenase